MFDDLIGNRNAATAIERMITAGRLPHSLLLAGPEGVGKKQFAIEVARSLVCTADERPCGRCPACRRADVFSIPKPDKKDEFEEVLFSEHPDIGLVIPYKRNILIGAIRDLEREANFRPFEARSRVFIIDDADRLNAAANALLKTLEEPPSTAYIILVSARPDRLLTTIRSRCQVIRFAPVPLPEIERYLSKDGHVSPDDAALIARVSRGSVGRALAIDLDAYRAARELLLEVLERAVSGRGLGVVLQISEQLADAKNKDRFEESLDILETLAHDLLVLRSGGSDIVNKDIERPLTRLAERSDTARLTAWVREIERLSAHLNVNLNRRAAADALFVRMATSGS
jgi:DNA polymerase-3 subunit delta'